MRGSRTRRRPRHESCMEVYTNNQSCSRRRSSAHIYVSFASLCYIAMYVCIIYLSCGKIKYYFSFFLFARSRAAFNHLANSLAERRRLYNNDVSRPYYIVEQKLIDCSAADADLLLFADVSAAFRRAYY